MTACELVAGGGKGGSRTACAWGSTGAVTQSWTKGPISLSSETLRGLDVSQGPGNISGPYKRHGDANSSSTGRGSCVHDHLLAVPLLGTARGSRKPQTIPTNQKNNISELQKVDQIAKSWAKATANMGDKKGQKGNSKLSSATLHVRQKERYQVQVKLDGRVL